MMRADAGTDLLAEYAAWLTDFLPSDYYERYREYRWDIEFRRGHQRAAFEAGWLQPTWPPEHGGRSLGLAEAMEIRLEAAIRSAPKLPNVAGGVAAPGIRQLRPSKSTVSWCRCCAGDEWALGMSEPEAGSDFAGLRTRPCATVTCSESRAERSGPPRRTSHDGAHCMPAPIQTHPSTAESPA